ncbi:hypothetical protein KEM55_001913 [Ascosphaera atra]|nr:hypothetical protein KEM55_001913 [Ascosphaera atra]
MPAKWDYEPDFKLILNSFIPPPKFEWEKVAQAMGDGYTAEACRQRVQKIRKLADQAPSGGSAPSTPAKKRKSATATPKKGTQNGNGNGSPAKKRGRTAVSEVVSDDELAVEDGSGGSDAVDEGNGVKKEKNQETREASNGATVLPSVEKEEAVDGPVKKEELAD